MSGRSRVRLSYSARARAKKVCVGVGDRYSRVAVYENRAALIITTIPSRKVCVGGGIEIAELPITTPIGS